MTAYGVDRRLTDHDHTLSHDLFAQLDVHNPDSPILLLHELQHRALLRRGGEVSRAYLKAGYFLRLIDIVTRVALAIQPHQKVVKGVSKVLFLVLRIADATPSWPLNLAVKSLVKLLLHLVNKSRPDADAAFAMEILHAVHGGRGLSAPMFKDRIVEQMCREPDEEWSYYSEAAYHQMGVMFYNLPGGSRLRFLMHVPEDIVVGWKIVPSGAPREHPDRGA